MVLNIGEVMTRGWRQLEGKSDESAIRMPPHQRGPRVG